MPRLKVFNAKDGKELLDAFIEVKGYLQSVPVQFSHDERSIALKVNDRSIVLFNLGPEQSGHMQQVSPRIPEDEFASFAFAPDGNLVATTKTGEVFEL